MEKYQRYGNVWQMKMVHVRSNYGWQWQRNNQLDYVVNKLKSNHKETRHAAISIYDCKEHGTYEFDTPCTYAVQFTILNMIN